MDIGLLEWYILLQVLLLFRLGKLTKLKCFLVSFTSY
jgi:hypothetical protein